MQESNIVLGIIGAVVSLVSLVAASVAGYVSLSLKAAQAAAETKAAERHIKTLEQAAALREQDRRERESDKADLYKLLNGSFVSVPLVQEMFRGHELRLTAAEGEIKSLREGA